MVFPSIAQFNSVVFTIREDEHNETAEDTLVLTVQDGQMPPRETHEFSTLADLLNWLNANGCSHLVWDEQRDEEDED